MSLIPLLLGANLAPSTVFRWTAVTAPTDNWNRLCGLTGFKDRWGDWEPYMWNQINAVLSATTANETWAFMAGDIWGANVNSGLATTWTKIPFKTESI